MEKPQEAESRQVWIDSPSGCPEIYCNMFNPSWTLYDVRFALGQLIPKTETNPKEAFLVEKRGAVTVAWPGVKSLAILLADLVRRYESVNGEIEPIKLAPNPEQEAKAAPPHPV